MSTGTRKDPLTTFLFGIKIADLGLDYESGTAFFKSVSGLSIETEVVDYQEGGVNDWVHKMQGVRKWPNIVLKQGFTGDPKLYQWKISRKRYNGTIVQLAPGAGSLKAVGQWNFKNGWPVKWVGPELDASKNELAIETIEIAHEGWEYSG